MAIWYAFAYAMSSVYDHPAIIFQLQYRWALD